MLRTIACAIITASSHSQRAALAVEAAKICLLRYPYCKPTLLEYVNTYLDGMGLSRIDDFTTPENLWERIRGKMIDEGLGVLYKAKTTKDIEKLGILADNVLVTAVLAVLDALGIECPSIYRETA